MLGWALHAGGGQAPSAAAEAEGTTQGPFWREKSNINNRSAGTAPATQVALLGMWLFCSHSKHPWMHLMFL